MAATDISPTRATAMALALLLLAACSGAGEGPDAEWLTDEPLRAAVEGLVGELQAVSELRGAAADDWLAEQGGTAAAAPRDQAPLLLRGLLGAVGSGAEASAWWRRPALVHRHGDLRVERRRPVEVAMFGAGHAEGVAAASAGTLPLREAVAELRRPGGVGQLFDQYAGEQLLSAYGGAGVSLFSSALSDMADHVLSLGRSGSGLPFHSHGQSWLELLQGHKLWLLHPPGPLPEVSQPWVPESEQLPLADWLATRLRRADPAPIVCLQRAGDLLYLPAAWHHATFNIGETVAIAGQFNRLQRSRSTGTAAEATAEANASRQDLLEAVEAAGSATAKGVALLRELRRREPGQVDSAARLVAALVGAAESAGAKKKSEKAAKKLLAAAKKEAVKVVRSVLKEVEAVMADEDTAALRVHCCALLTDLGQLDAALGCLAAVDLGLPAIGERGYGALKRHYEAVRARLRGIERAMRRGEEVVRSQVEVIANGLKAVLAVDPQHRGALEYRAVLRAMPPDGLGWDDF